MIYRLLLTLGLLSALLFTVTALRMWAFRRRRVGVRRLSSGLLSPGVATLVAFHTETCAPCRLQQNPAIEEVRKDYGARLAVRHVDVGREREVAGALGVWTVPTTLLFDKRGRIRAVNDSLALAPQLRRQVAEVLGSAR